MQQFSYNIQLADHVYYQNSGKMHEVNKFIYGREEFIELGGRTHKMIDILGEYWPRRKSAPGVRGRPFSVTDAWLPSLSPWRLQPVDLEEFDQINPKPTVWSGD